MFEEFGAFGNGVWAVMILCTRYPTSDDIWTAQEIWDCRWRESSVCGKITLKLERSLRSHQEYNIRLRELPATFPNGNETCYGHDHDHDCRVLRLTSIAEYNQVDRLPSQVIALTHFLKSKVGG